MAEKKSGTRGGRTGARKTRRSAAADEAAVRERIVNATMELAVERPFSAITRADIAAAAGLTLAELRRHIAAPADALRLLARRIDEQVLASLADDPLEGEPADRLFELVMRRLERLAPWRAAIRNILREAPVLAGEHPPLVCQYLLSQQWMLAAAGLERPGLEGAACALALGAVHARALRTWVDDDDPGLSRTMAQLDRDLKRAVEWRDRLAGPAEAARSVCRAGCALVGGVWRLVRPRARTPETTDAEPDVTVQPAGEEPAAG